MKDYTIKIQQIFTNNANIEGEIELVCFEIEGTDGDYSASCYGEVKLHSANPSNFTNLSETTESQVAQWVKDALGDKIEEYESIVDARIESQKNSLIATELPWNNSVE
jgi:hypothetical protein